MSLWTDQAVVSTVYFDAASTSTAGLGEGGSATNEAGETIASISGGVLRWMPSQCGSVMVANGTTIRGLQPINPLGVDMLAADIDGIEQPATARRLAMLMLHAPPSGSFTATHQDQAVAEHQRITTDFGAGVVYGPGRVQVFSESRDGSRIWRAPDWSVPKPIPRAHVHGSTAAPTRNLDTWAVLEEMTAAVDTNGTLDIEFEGTFAAAPPLVSPTVTGQLRYTIDGVPVANSTRTVHYKTPSIAMLEPGEVHMNVALPKLRATGLGANVTVAVEWSVTAGTLTAVGTERSLRIDQPVV